MFSFQQTVLFTDSSHVDFLLRANCIKCNPGIFFNYNLCGLCSCRTELVTVVFRQACPLLGSSCPLLHPDINTTMLMLSELKLFYFVTNFTLNIFSINWNMYFLVSVSAYLLIGFPEWSWQWYLPSSSADFSK